MVKRLLCKRLKDNGGVDCCAASKNSARKYKKHNRGNHAKVESVKLFGNDWDLS